MLYYKRDTSGTTNWNSATSWSTISSTSAFNAGTFPSSTTLDPVIFDAFSSNVTINVVSTCTSLDFTSYAGTITMTSNLTVYGNITLGVSMGIAGLGTLAIQATSTYTSNGVTWPNTLTLASFGTNIIVTLASPITTVQNLSNTGSNTANITTINGNTLNILGNLTILVILAGSTQVNLIGTGTWNALNANIEVRTKLNIDTLGTITRGTNGYAYAGPELKYTQGNLVNGSTNLVLSVLASTSSIISNGVNWGNVNIYGNTTLTDDMNINNLAFNIATLNGNNLRINGNITMAGGQLLAGTTTLQIIGTGNQTWSSVNTVARIANNMNIDKVSGTFTLSSANIAYGSATAVLTYTQGTFVPGTSIFITQAGTTFNIIGSGFSLYNWSPITGTYTINTNPLVVNSSLLLAGSTTFAGTHGFTTQNLTCTVAASIIRLQNIIASSTAEYIVNGFLQLSGTLLNRISLEASGRANFTGSIETAVSPTGSAMNITTVTGGTIATGMTVSQASGVIPTGLAPFINDRPTIVSGASLSWVLSKSLITRVPTPTGVTTLAAGYKAKFTLSNNGLSSQNVIYVSTQDIDSSFGSTILVAGSAGDDTAVNTALYRTLNWGPLVAPSGSVYYTFVN